MRIGLPTEIKPDEKRVALTAYGVRELTDAGHEVIVQSGAGADSSIRDDDYGDQGAEIVADAETVFSRADLIVKVKEPQPAEVALLEPRHTLFTFLHLAASPALTVALTKSGASCLAYETIEDDNGRLPLLKPMSEIAGRIAAQAGAFMLQSSQGGSGVLPGGVPGVDPATVIIIGGGVVGASAAAVAIGLGADVHVYDRDLERLRELETMLGGRCTTHFASALTVESRLAVADLVIGAVLVRGARAPWVIRRQQLGLMKRGTVLVDVSIDQGGCFETSRPTTHSVPTYEVEGIVHYCVANMPGTVPVTSTLALTNATLPYVLRLADQGLEALRGDPGLLLGLNVHGGEVTHETVARDLGLPYVPPERALTRHSSPTGVAAG